MAAQFLSPPILQVADSGTMVSIPEQVTDVTQEANQTLPRSNYSDVSLENSTLSYNSLDENPLVKTTYFGLHMRSP
jgi:hypothetical protein